MRALKIAVLLVAVGVLLGACGSAGQGVDPSTTETTVELTPPSPSETAGCDQAMRTYGQALVNAPKDANGAPVLDPTTSSGLQLATLNTCTREQWLAAAVPYARAGDPTAIAAPDQVKAALGALCAGRTPTPPACE